MKLLLLALTIFLAGLCARGADAPTATNSSALTGTDNPVVARGKGFEITRRELDQVLATSRISRVPGHDPQAELPREATADADFRALLYLIEIRLVMGKTTEPERVEGKRQNDEDFTNIVKILSQPEFERRLKQTDMTADELRLMLFQRSTAQESLTRQLGIKVTDAEAKKYFDQNPRAFDQPAKVRIRELVFLTTSDWTTSDAPPLPAAWIEARYKEICDLHRRILAGEDFAALARQYNELPLSKESNNERTFTKDQMEIGPLAFSMKTNQISGVVTNEANFCIFQLLEKIPAKKAAFEEVAERIKKGITGYKKQQLAPDYIRQLRQEADVEILDPKLKAQEAHNESLRAEAEKKQAEFITKLAVVVTNTSPQFTNGSQHTKIPAPQPPPAKP